MLTTVPGALLTGQTVGSSARSSTRSASLPGVSVPILRSRLAQRAPAMVANSSASRQVMRAGRLRSPARARAKICERWNVNVWRMTVKKSCAIVTGWSELKLGRSPRSSASWMLGVPWPMAMSICGHCETLPPLSLMSFHASSVRFKQWIFIAGPKQAGPPEFHESGARVGGDEVQDGRHAGLARGSKNLRIEPRPQCKREQLIFRAKVGPRQSGDVLGILRGCGIPARVSEHSADTGFLKRVDTGIAVLGRMADLRQVHNRGDAHVDHGDRCHQHARMNLRRRKCRRELRLDVAVVIGLKNAVRHDAAHQALVRVVVGIDKARDNDPVGAIDHRRVARRGDLGADIANLAVLDQHVAFGEVADLGIEGEEDSPLDEDPPRALQAHKCRIANILGPRSTRERLSGDATGEKAGAGPQQCATRRSRNPAGGFVALWHVDLP